MKGKKSRTSAGQVVSHTAAILFFIAITAIVILYSAGRFSFSLPWYEHTLPEVTKSPAEIAFEKYIASLSSGNLGEITGAPDSSSDETSSVEVPPAPIVFPSLSELVSEGYRISYDNFTPDFKIATVSILCDELPVDLTFENSYLKKILTPYSLEEGGQLYESYKTLYEERLGIEVYMGRFFVDNNDSTISIYRNDGSFITRLPQNDVFPAFTRDKNNNPLFFKEEKYYYLDEASGQMIEADYNDKNDNRGYYFDYNPSFGKLPDRNYNVHWRIEKVSFDYDLDTSTYYTRFKVDPRIARALYELDPNYAFKVAVQQPNGHYYNYPFKLALDKAIEEIKREEKTRAETEPEASPDSLPSPPVEESTVYTETTSPIPETPTAEETTLSPETTAAEPDVSTFIEETAVTPESSDIETTYDHADISTSPELSGENAAVPGETVSPETVFTETTVASHESTADPSTDTQGSETTTDIPQTTEPYDTTDTLPVSEPVDTTDTEPLTEQTKTTETKEPEVTEPKYDPILHVHTEFELPRFGYGPSADNFYIDGNYARAYEFSERYACVVDDYGVMRIINSYGRVTLNYRREFKTDADAGFVYMKEVYYQPIYNDLEHLGYYYFDHGLVRVRALTHMLNEGDVVNYITGDSDRLITPYGVEYEIPKGYKLVSYSNGILLLEREGRYGYYHKDGYWIAQPLYTYARPFIEGLGVIGFDDGVKGAVDTSGNIVIPFKYTHLTNSSSGIFAAYNESDGWTALAKVIK